MNGSLHVLYLAPWLPKLSETFVYRELFALRAAGVRVSTASLHRPERGLGDAALDELAAETLCVYGAGPVRMLGFSLVEAVRHPRRALRTFSMVLGDVLRAKDAKGRARLKIAWHGAAGLALAHAARSRGVTHLHAHFAHVSASVAMYAARQMDCPFSFTGHAVDLFRDRVLLPQKLSRAAFVCCISHWHRGFYQSMVPRPEADYPVVRCGVNPSEFVPPSSCGEAGVIRFMGVGRMIPKKGFDLLLEALAVLRREGMAFTCRLLGDGPEWGPLKSQAERLGLTHAVDFPGATPNSAVRDAMREADLFVLPCRVDSNGDRDGIPVVLMEAMASGICAVSGDLPAIRELIEDGKSGCLVPPGDGNALAACLRTLCMDDARRARLARAGRERICEEFSLDLNARRLHQALLRQQGNGGANGLP